VLLIDDEPPLLRMMGVYLGRLGYAVTTADTHAAALEAIEGAEEKFSVVVIDATMPGPSMAETSVKMLVADPELRVIASSGYPADMTLLEAAGPGRVMFLHKPFTPEMLADAVRRMLAGPEA
jgi:DNA-binding NtrC family response regulator